MAAACLSAGECLFLELHLVIPLCHMQLMEKKFNGMQGGIGPAGLATEDLHVLDFTDFDRPRWHRYAATRS